MHLRAPPVTDLIRSDLAMWRKGFFPPPFWVAKVPWRTILTAIFLAVCTSSVAALFAAGGEVPFTSFSRSSGCAFDESANDIAITVIGSYGVLLHIGYCAAMLWRKPDTLFRSTIGRDARLMCLATPCKPRAVHRECAVEMGPVVLSKV